MPITIMTIYDIRVCYGALYIVRASVCWLLFISFRCFFISNNSSSNVLRNIWWDYLQKLRSLEALEFSSCRLRNSLIKLIAFMLLLKLLNWLIWNKKRILGDSCGIAAHCSGSSMDGTHPTVMHTIGSKTALSTERQEGTERFEPRLFKDTRTASALLVMSTVLISSLNGESNSAWNCSLFRNGSN